MAAFEPRVYNDHGVQHTFHDAERIVIVTIPGCLPTARQMTYQEIEQAEQGRLVRALDEPEPGFVAYLLLHITQPRSWLDVVMVLALLAGVVAIGTFIQTGSPAHLGR